MHQRAGAARREEPSDCPAFGGRCTPESPLGATMVSSEGACAAYHAYGKDRVPLTRLTQGKVAPSGALP